MNKWKTIPSHLNYEVNSSGGIRNKKTGELLKTWIGKYKRTKLGLLHRLIALTFIPNPNNLPQINHRDCNKLNNDINNLEWCDNRYNQIYSFKIGGRKPTKCFGKKNGMFGKTFADFGMEHPMHLKKIRNQCL